ncbi:MAG: tetratricopeptide repeat protein [Myxococcales bacterium]
MAVGLAGAAAFVAAVFVAPQALAKKKKKKKTAAKKNGGVKTREAVSHEEEAKVPKAPSILSTKSAVHETKQRAGPASYAKSKLTAAERDAKADEKRTEEIEELKKIIPKIQDGPQKADLLFQLAELWWEKSKFMYFTEMTDYDKAYQEYTAQENQGAKGLHEPKVNTRQSDLYREQAIELYEKILSDYQTYPRADEVLFNLAYNLYDTGKKKEAIARYWDLIRQHPDSKFVPDAYVQMGEHFFNSNDLEKARKAYQKALAFDIPQIYAFALYKLAWCDFNAQAYEEAIHKFQKVVAYQEQAIASGARAERKDKIQLKNEALADMVLSWAQLNAVDQARDYYAQHASRRKTHHLMARLANVYFDSGKSDPAIRTYKMIIDEDPNDPEDPAYQANIVKAYEAERMRDKVRVELKKLVDSYKPGTDWAQANSRNKNALAAAYDLTEGSMRELVTDYHQEAQKTKSVATYRLARDIYKEYLDNFATSDSAYNLRFYYAEILYALQEWEKAAEQYALVVKQNPKGLYSKSAAYAELLSYEKLVAISKGTLQQRELADNEKIDEKAKKGSITRVKQVKAEKAMHEEPIPKWEQALADACDNYVRLYPGNQDEVVVRYKAAFIYYDHYHFVDAGKRLGEVITKWPQNELAGKAADLIMDALAGQGQVAELNDLAWKFYKNHLLAKAGSKFALHLMDIIQRTQYQLAVEAFGKKDYDRSGSMFLAFVKEFPKSPFAQKAVFSAMAGFEHGNKLELAIKEGEQLLRDYPQGDLAQQALYQLARDYEFTADFDKAASLYEQYVTKYPTDKKSADSLFDAALWNEGLGHFDKALALYEKYIKTYKDRKDVPEIQFNLGLIYEKQKDWKNAAKAFDTYAKVYGKDLTRGKIYFAEYKQMEDLRKAGEGANEKIAGKIGEELLKGYGELSEAERKDDGNLNAYAQLRFHQLDPLWGRYVGIKFDNPLKLKKQLKEKLATLPEVEKAYTGVLALGDGDFGIAALTRIGFAYLDFAKNLTDSPDPKGLSPDLLDQYRAELENRALPLEDKGIEAIEKGLAKGSELEVYNEWTLKAEDQENKYRPGAFGEIHALPYQGSEFFAVAGLEEQPGPAHPETAPAPESKPPPAEAPVKEQDSDEGAEGAGSQ